MRTTIQFDPDTARAVERLRDEGGRGVSEAVNELMRRGMVNMDSREPFVPRPHVLGLKIDVSDIAGALDLLEGPAAR